MLKPVMRPRLQAWFGKSNPLRWIKPRLPVGR